MTEYIILFIAAILAIGGYAFMASVSLKSMVPAILLGLAAMVICLVCEHYNVSSFLSNLFAATFIYIGCAVCARIFKAPVTIFLLPAQIILVPGRNLYQSVSYMLSSEYSLAWQECLKTGEIAAGIACGLICGPVIFSAVFEIIALINRLCNKIKVKK